MEGLSTYDELILIQSELGVRRLDYWKEEVLFTFDWWAMILFFFVAWILWFRLADRSRLLELSFFGGIIFFLALKLDVLGTELELWDYPKMVLPWGSRLLIVDIVLPVFYMLAYQFTSSWRSFFAAITGMAVVFAYVLEPFMVKVGVYHPNNWEYTFSIPGYVGIGLIARWATEAVLRRTAAKPTAL